MFTFGRVWGAGAKPNGSGVGDVPPNPAPLLPRTLRVQNKHRCAPSMFKYHLEQESVIIEVKFKEEEEAEIFKQYFDRARTIKARA
jgi:hypothetical protein